MERYLKKILREDALHSHKMAFVSGPRQVGKTTMGKSLLDSRQNYFSWDRTSFRKAWARSPEEAIQDLGKGPVLLDEIHKDRRWKTRLKGVYDSLGDRLEIIVTGSARLDLFRKGSDSLLGRYIPYRLHPFSVAESSDPPTPEELLQRSTVNYRWEDLIALGGFPEPLLGSHQRKAERWSRLRLDRLAFEDTRDIKTLSDLNAFRLLLDLIPEKIGSLFSFNSLREDVGVAYATVRDWVMVAEALYFGFFVRPYSRGVRRAIRAEPKFYLYDILQIPQIERAKRLENLTALHLLKACQYWTDSGQGLYELHFVRDKERREVDFLVTRERKPWVLIECKSNSKSPSSRLAHFAEELKCSLNYQLVEGSGIDRLFPAQNIRIVDYEKFFSGWV
ncbi:MAG: hypothetical protein C5B49_02940 [Bdellovibrio sp.]|nr:MAG: hypothetical protein C5B49_02940 [Bdellovibrio sp.]